MNFQLTLWSLFISIYYLIITKTIRKEICNLSSEPTETLKPQTKPSKKSVMGAKHVDVKSLDRKISRMIFSKLLDLLTLVHLWTAKNSRIKSVLKKVGLT